MIRSAATATEAGADGVTAINTIRAGMVDRAAKITFGAVFPARPSRR